jgi:hypothetical protein
MTADFAAIAITLYAAHHVGDYWVQTDHQACHKGAAGAEGRWACLAHVLSYLATQFTLLVVLALVTDVQISPAGLPLALIVSGVTHYMADRREHGLMFKLVHRMPWKAGYLQIGAVHLDQSWHIFWGVFVAGLLAVSL